MSSCNTRIKYRVGVGFTRILPSNPKKEKIEEGSFTVNLSITADIWPPRRMPDRLCSITTTITSFAVRHPNPITILSHKSGLQYHCSVQHNSSLTIMLRKNIAPPSSTTDYRTDEVLGRHWHESYLARFDVLVFFFL